MNARTILGIAVLAAAAVTACGSLDTGGLTAREPGNQDPNDTDDTPGETPGQTPGTPGAPGTLPTNSKAGKALYEKEGFSCGCTVRVRGQCSAE